MERLNCLPGVKIPRHLMPKQLHLAARKELVDAVLRRPRLRPEFDPMAGSPSKQPEPLPGTREAVRWGLIERIEARRRARR